MSIIGGALSVGADLLFLQPSIDVVAVLDSGFNQLFPDARPIRANVREQSKVMEHPLETGQIITDYKIVLPIEIEFTMVVPVADYKNTYQQISQIYLSSELLTVQTKSASYENMIIMEMPHEERPDMYDVLSMTLRFKQINIVQADSNFAPADPTQANTQSIGQQAPTTVPSPSAATQQQVTASFLAGG